MKIKKVAGPVDKIVMKTRPAASGSDNRGALAEWWKASTDEQLAGELCGTASYLKQNQSYRLRQLAVSIRLYCGMSVYNYAGSTVSKMDRSRTLPDDRPSFNIISSCVDTLVSRLTQNEPQPKFLCDGADYKQRHLAMELNDFILGEFYQTKMYEKAAKILRDGCAMGTGLLKIYHDRITNKVAVDRVMATDLYVDENDSLNGRPQQLIQMKLVDRDKMIATDGAKKAIIMGTPNSYPDNAPDSGRTASDQIMLVEGWRLASGPDPEAKGYRPGRHTIATVGGIIFDEPKWKKDRFPFVKLDYSDPFLGYWGQGIGTRLFGTQMSINRIMYTIARAISLVGVPRVFVEQHSKVVNAHNNNEVGVIIKYSGTKPSYEVAPCNAPELYAERDKLIEYGFRQEGISNMQATGQKPQGLDSGEAIRSADDINSDRVSSVSKKYENIFVDAAYLMTDTAMDICEEIGSYETVYPNKDGTKQINLPEMDILKNPFVIKCFTESSLPRSPAGRIATVTEQVQAGMLSIKEGRRLMNFPDLEENERLDNASEERIFKILDEIVESGKYTMPDPFMDLQVASTLVVQYYNLYMAANLEEEKADLLRLFFNQVQHLIQVATPQPTAPTPTANPMPAPTSPLVPNTNAAAA